MIIFLQKHYRLLSIALFVLSSAIFISCNSETSERFNYGTDNLEAQRLYDLGWKQIMDRGEWTESEASYRKAAASDSEFLMPLSLVGRLTPDLQERDSIMIHLNANKDNLNADQRLLLDVYMKSMELLTMRDRGIAFPSGFIDEYYTISEQNFRTFVHKYPKEDYVFSEYIEILHARYGPKAAIDSLHVLATPAQKELPFLNSYEAMMQAELGKFDKALSLASRLRKKLNDPNLSSTYATYAEIYFQMDSLALAKKEVNKALTLEPNHIIAQRLQLKIDNLMSLSE